MTRFAGLEIGSTKDAALAIRAQMNRKGSGFLTFAVLMAAATAGVSTTAVASFDRKIVTIVPTPKIKRNSRCGEPAARFVARAASQSNKPLVARFRQAASCQEEKDRRPFPSGPRPNRVEPDQVEREQHAAAEHSPDRLGPREGANDDAGGCEGRDRPNHCDGVQRIPELSRASSRG